MGAVRPRTHDADTDLTELAPCLCFEDVSCINHALSMLQAKRVKEQ